MADEIVVRVNLQNTSDYRGVGPQAFTLDLEGTFRGPYPGAVSISVSGTDIDLSSFSRVGMVDLWNQDATNFVEYGVYEPSSNIFYPLGEIGPGERYVLKLSRNLGEEWASIGTGTGTSGDNNRLRFRADTAACNVFIGAFER